MDHTRRHKICNMVKSSYGSNNSTKHWMPQLLFLGSCVRFTDSNFAKIADFISILPSRGDFLPVGGILLHLQTPLA